MKAAAAAAAGLAATAERTFDDDAPLRGESRKMLTGNVCVRVRVWWRRRQFCNNGIDM
jgi:hypothetical protein